MIAAGLPQIETRPGTNRTTISCPVCPWKCERRLGDGDNAIHAEWDHHSASTGHGREPSDRNLAEQGP